MIENILAIPVFILGVILLWKGSDFLVDGTTKTAFQLGISTLIISVLFVGFGTSVPEFAISVGAAAQKNPDISLGNIVGSCVANLLLVLGLSSFIKPIKINKSILKREYIVVLLVTFILLVFAYFDLLDKYRIIGGLLFIIFFALFIIFFIRCAKKERDNNKKFKKQAISKNILFIIIGIICVVAGAYLLIWSAEVIATLFGIPTFIIALSMVAIGTSLPELVVSCVAAYKDESDIAVGNVLGSNVFNILLILGFSAFFIPLLAMEYINHIIILLIVTLIMFPILVTRNRISRIEGVFLLVIYAIFIWYIFFGVNITI
jgi:cation:H+ antiporter